MLGRLWGRQTHPKALLTRLYSKKAPPQNVVVDQEPDSISGQFVKAWSTTSIQELIFPTFFTLSFLFYYQRKRTEIHNLNEQIKKLVSEKEASGLAQSPQDPQQLANFQRKYLNETRIKILQQVPSLAVALNVEPDLLRNQIDLVIQQIYHNEPLQNTDTQAPNTQAPHTQQLN
eukprot:TRINITY_DN818_c0_g1_i1.p1 TRINITY_DN818_c0_g1~~TRINITY_DN818_c0_g1_i1.p1  ORF type:complete len:181 (+),score=55.30 TRINITY_DN818_c0_g1_i1:22-543(+)